MDENRLKNTVASVRSTQEKFNELAQRGKQLDAQLEQLPAIPNLSTRLIAIVVLVFLIVGLIIGAAILLA